MRRGREEIVSLLGDGFISRQSPPAEAADRAVDTWQRLAPSPRLQRRWHLSPRL